MVDKVPAHILGKRPTTPAEFAAQQDRIAEWVRDQMTKEVEDHANEGKNK